MNKQKEPIKTTAEVPMIIHVRLLGLLGTSEPQRRQKHANMKLIVRASGSQEKFKFMLLFRPASWEGVKPCPQGFWDMDGYSDSDIVNISKCKKSK